MADLTPKCPGCGYDIGSLIANRDEIVCPECGRLTSSGEIAVLRRFVPWRSTLLAVIPWSAITVVMLTIFVVTFPLSITVFRSLVVSMVLVGLFGSMLGAYLGGRTERRHGVRQAWLIALVAWFLTSAAFSVAFSCLESSSGTACGSSQATHHEDKPNCDIEEDCREKAAL